VNGSGSKHRGNLARLSVLELQREVAGAFPCLPAQTNKKRRTLVIRDSRRTSSSLEISTKRPYAKRGDFAIASFGSFWWGQSPNSIWICASPRVWRNVKNYTTSAPSGQSPFLS
jgi:hypothetical protein